VLSKTKRIDREKMRFAISAHPTKTNGIFSCLQRLRKVPFQEFIKGNIVSVFNRLLVN
jgi:hypothetical protein